MADNDVSKMKVADLKKELKNRGLLTTGNKNELVERLQAALIEGDVFDDTMISEDLLDDNDDDVLNDEELEEEKLLEQDEDVILKSPLESSLIKSPKDSAASSTDGQSQKKVVLKRNLTTQFSFTETETTKTDTTPAVVAASPLPQRKFTRISLEHDTAAEKPSKTDGADEEAEDGKKGLKMTQLERLELRAKKFGAPVSADAAKVARAERFGISETASKATSEKIVANPATIDVLKKRAERFGGSVSKVMSKIENSEKLQKRQERFGNATTTSTTTITSATTPTSTTTTTESSTGENKTDFAEKARLRLERFKTAVK